MYKHRNKKNREQNKNTAGFSILEAMVSLSLLTMGILGALSLTSGNIGEALYSKDQITAFYLAQEAIEFVRNARNNNSNLPLSKWLVDSANVDLSSCINGLVGCTIDVLDSGVIGQCDAQSTCPYINYDNADTKKLYTYQNGSESYETIFQRWVKITKMNNEEREAKVVATVKWTTKTGIVKKVELEEHLFNFK